MKIILNTIALTVISTSAFAAANKIATPAVPITCPKEIICSMDRKVSSCKLTKDNLEHWYGFLETDDEYSAIKKGTYRFNEASTSYQSSDSVYAQTDCQYNNGMGSYLTLLSRYNHDGHAAILEAAPGKGTAWSISGDFAFCRTDNSLLCPFKIVPSLDMKSNIEIPESFVIVHANVGGIEVSKFVGDGKITLYALREAGCNNSNACQINLVLDIVNWIDIGNVVIDTTQNKLQVIKINSLASSGHVISQDDSSGYLLVSAVKDK